MAKKQLVFIMTDTQRFDMCSCYGKNKGLETPNIDALAASGVRYERAYTTQPVCGPARSGLFTGTYPAWNGSWANGMALGDNVKTIGQRLRDNGYHCAYIGKWHLDGTDYFGNGFCPDGWDEEYWYDMRRYLEEMSEDERIMSRAAKSMTLTQIPEEFTYGYKVMKRALNFMERYKDEDYLLVVSFDEPHAPFLCPPPFDTMYKDFEFPKDPAVYDTLGGKPGYQKVWAAQKGPQTDRDAVRIKEQFYFGCNAYVDTLIGRVAEAAPENALLMYTSDHGDLLQSHCLFAKGPACYDAVARIPLIIRNPQGIKGGVYDRGPVSHISICPTIMEYFDLPVPRVLQGESILNTTLDPDASAPQYVFYEFTRFEQDHDFYGGFQPMRVCTDARYKLAINLMSEDELYDLEQDPYECCNLIHDPAYAKDRDRLHDALIERMYVHRDPFRGWYWMNRPWRTDAPEPSWFDRGWTRQRENEEYEPRQLDFVNGIEMVHAQRFKVNNGNFSYASLQEMIDFLRDYDRK
ncbi:MAG: sulfatase-like hydrolase/transferase [Clostridia bacterium]|nr:sulfatase-like hydrolase/transferase [Clostridia bacterium]MBR6300526.1 sulfatase-like hydrolase/transferase [Clostridia bacterium]